MFLLGRLLTPQSEAVKRIAQAFNTSFEVFREDKEVKNAMTIAEKYRNEGWVDGEEAGVNKIAELIKSGLSVDEALHKFNEERKLRGPNFTRTPA